MQRAKRRDESFDFLPTHQRVLEAPDHVRTKAGGVRNRPIPLNARNTRLANQTKSQVLTNCEDPLRRVLSNRKKADPILARILRQRNMKRNSEGFFIARVKIVAVLVSRIGRNFSTGFSCCNLIMNEHCYWQQLLRVSNMKSPFLIAYRVVAEPLISHRDSVSRYFR